MFKPIDSCTYLNIKADIRQNLNETFFYNGGTDEIYYPINFFYLNDTINENITVKCIREFC